MHSEIQIVSILFTCLYNNNTLADSEIYKFIDFEFRNYRLRLEWHYNRSSHIMIVTYLEVLVSPESLTMTAHSINLQYPLVNL